MQSQPPTDEFPPTHDGDAHRQIEKLKQSNRLLATLVALQLVALVVLSGFLGWFLAKDMTTPNTDHRDIATPTAAPPALRDARTPTADKTADVETKPTGTETSPPTMPSAHPLQISQVERLQRSFNPTASETTTIRFSLSAPADITLDILGPNRERITRLLDGKPHPAGLSSAIWNGHDLEGNVVPNEAYTVTIAAVSETESDLWDPLATSGGQRVTATRLRTIGGDRFSYQIPVAARVLVRAAVVDGPLLRTMVNWRPRTAGLCNEQWNGADADGLRRLADIEGLRLGVMAFALPDKSIITVGNDTLDYATCYRDTASNRPHNEPTPRIKDPDTIISPHWRIPPHQNRDPAISMEFLDIESVDATEGQPTRYVVPQRTGTVLVRVDIPAPHERNFMNDQKFELIIFVDDKRILEVERGHVPFSYPWDVSKLTPGRHMFTVNVATFRNHVGTTSRWVEIVE